MELFFLFSFVFGELQVHREKTIDLRFFFFWLVFGFDLFETVSHCIDLAGLKLAV